MTISPLPLQKTVSQFVTFTRFPFDFAQGGEPVEPLQQENAKSELVNLFGHHSPDRLTAIEISVKLTIVI